VILKLPRTITFGQNENSTLSGQSAAHSDLVEIAKRNGDFKKNYGLLVGAFFAR
jgi:hypothetical protein